ncbi:MAG: penicillin-binding protein activator, partial [Gammaproteobacteria bacterium]|nr:penicillin-binding protein activator [Gammaproteobacteria bacterium]
NTATEKELGWYELALIYKTHFANPKNLQAVINDWSVRYPGHNALIAIVPELIASSEARSTRPKHVAVLLPMSGRYRDASRAIRDGFIAAWNTDDTEKSRLSFYNTDSLNIIENYQQAISDGADFIIGPLEKAAIERLLEQGSLSRTTLALNYYDGKLDDGRFEHVKPGGNFFQFALSPENEAEQVAERAFFDGHIRALVITTGDEWGDRVYTAFQKRWQGLGGVILEQARYTTGIEDYSEPIRKLLNTDDSKQRAKELRAILNRSIHSEERRRQDADFIFIASQPEIARQVMPHIRFLRAGNLPVYATSHIYTGQPNPVRDADMNNIIFADMPWNLDPDFYHSQAKAVINDTWPHLAGSYQRLYALGYDAYAVIPELPLLAADNRNRFNGATGDLHVTDQGRIQRFLTWARFVDGQPQVSHSSP